jgi:hypothetical protein
MAGKQGRAGKEALMAEQAVSHSRSQVRAIREAGS